MQHLRFLSMVIIVLVNAGCNKEPQKPSGLLSYDQAIHIAKQYVRKSGLYKPGKTSVLYEPNNTFWNAYSSRSPEMLEDYGLIHRNYYAILFYEEGVRDGGATVFVDKEEKRIIGILYSDHFEKIPAK